jgi:GH24 family phage-related lysozyme (muramidase)
MTESKTRRPLSPTALSAEQYTQLMWEHLARLEGLGGRIYSDPLGIPTMGAGIALAKKQKDGTFVLDDRKSIGAMVSGDPAEPYQFSEGEWTRLQNVVTKLNDTKLPKAERAAQAKALIPPLSNWEANTGRVIPERNQFGFSMNLDRMRNLAMEKLPEYKNRAIDSIKDRAIKNGMSAQEAQDYADTLRGSAQDAGFTSLVYNGIKPAKAVDALLSGDRAELRRQVFYQSNKNGLPGLATRRRDEAGMITGDPATWPAEDQARWQKVEDSPEAQAYRDRFAKALGQKPARLRTDVPPIPLPRPKDWPPAEAITADSATDGPPQPPAPADSTPPPPSPAEIGSEAEKPADAQSFPPVSPDAIVKMARSHMGHNYYGLAPISRDLGSLTFKDHQFVGDVLHDTGAGNFRQAHQRPEIGDWADRAAEIAGWPVVDGPPRKGDVLAMPRQNNDGPHGMRLGQLGIATGDGDSIAVTNGSSVSRGDIGLRDGDNATIRRYANLDDQADGDPAVRRFANLDNGDDGAN